MSNHPVIESKGVFECVIFGDECVTHNRHMFAPSSTLYLVELPTGEWAICDASQVGIYATYIFDASERARAQECYEACIDQWRPIS